MKTFQFTCLKCGSRRVHLIQDSTVNFAYTSCRQINTICACLDCNNIEEYYPEPAIPKNKN